MRVKQEVIDHSPWLSLALLEGLDILGIMLLCNEALKVYVSIVWGGSGSLIVPGLPRSGYLEEGWRVGCCYQKGTLLWVPGGKIDRRERGRNALGLDRPICVYFIAHSNEVLVSGQQAQRFP